MQEFKEKYLRKLKRKARQINADHNETLGIFTSAKTEFITSILEYCKNNNLDPPLENVEKREKSSSREENFIFTETEIKDVYKKIAVCTHPDKLLGLNDEDREKKTALFKKASEAKDLKDLCGLTQIASELNINLNNLKYTQLELLEYQIEKKAQKTEEMHNDIAWRWYYSDNSCREKTTQFICGSRSQV